MDMWAEFWLVLVECEQLVRIVGRVRGSVSEPF